MEKLQALVKSRRFWVAVSGVLSVCFQDTLGLTEDQAQQLLAIAGVWILGDSVQKTK